MAIINPHINFNGNAEEAFTFYQSVFGGAITKIIRFKDIASAEFPVPEKEENKIMHIAMQVGTQNLLMGNDVPEFMDRVNENENRSKISITAASQEEADQLFSGLSAGGQIEIPLSQSADGAWFGMFRDRYGIEWMVSYNPKHHENV